MPTLVKWIAVVAAAAISLYLFVVLDRMINATIEHVDEEIAHERAELEESAARKERQLARRLHVLATRITGTQQEFHVRDLRFRRQNPSE